MNITLKKLSLDDCQAWTIWDSTPLVLEYLPEPHEENPSFSFQEDFYNECQNDECGFYRTIFDESEDVPIGIISLTEINRYHGIGELGIVIGDTNYWGRGVASRAVDMFISEIRENLPEVQRITAEIEAENTAMQKVLLKNGFELEVICRKSRIKRGKRINTERYVLFIN